MGEVYGDRGIGSIARLPMSTATETVLILDFGSDKTATSGDFTIVFPTADASNAIIRIA
jgi:hypothetical protein